MKFFKTFLAFALLFAIGGCGGDQYSFQIFPFPEGITPDDPSFKYHAKIIVLSKESGSMYHKSQKEIRVQIYDKNRKKLLDDIVKYDAALITAKVDWINENSIKVTFIESGSDNVNDEYSSALANSGDRVISVLSFQMKNGKFIQNEKHF